MVEQGSLYVMNNGARLNCFISEAFRKVVENPVIVPVTSFRRGIPHLKERYFSLCVSDIYDLDGLTITDDYFEELGRQARVMLFSDEDVQSLKLARENRWSFFSKGYGHNDLVKLLVPVITKLLDGPERVEKLFAPERKKRLTEVLADYSPNGKRDGVGARFSDENGRIRRVY